MNAILLASAGVVILLVGSGIGFWVGRSGVGGSKARFEKAEAELDEYKRNVTEHFGQTATHFQAIGEQYRELYEHMATGAQALCESDEAGKRLLFAPGGDASSTKVEGPTTDGAQEAERPPIDYAEQPIETEEARVSETAAEPMDEQPVETVADAATADMAEEPAKETAAEPQPEAKDDSGDRTLH